MRHPSCAESDRAIWELYSFDRPRSELPGDSSIRRRAEKSVCPRRNHVPITANPQRACRQSSRARIQEIAFHGSAQIVVGLAHGVNAAFVRHFCKRVGCRVALRSASPLRILATRPIFGPGGWVARQRPPFWPHFFTPEGLKQANVAVQPAAPGAVPAKECFACRKRLHQRK